jgi:hypothetical protein
MKSPKILIVFSMITILAVSCEFQPFATISPEITSTSTPSATATIAPPIIPTSITIAVPTVLPLAVSAESCAFANGQLPQIPTPEAFNQGLDLRGDMSKSLGGGVVQSKDFTIELILYCDKYFGPFSMEPYFNSDIDHLAVFINWRYDGTIENAPSYIVQGIEPNLHGYALDKKEKDLNGGHGISRGLFKPFPDFSSKVTLHFVYIALFPSGEFSGAVLSFDLQQVSDGLQPSNVFVAPLSDKDKVLVRNTGLYTSVLATVERGPTLSAERKVLWANRLLIC